MKSGRSERKAGIGESKQLQERTGECVPGVQEAEAAGKERAGSTGAARSGCVLLLTTMFYESTL